jgi:hypothetical protein
MKGFTFNQKIEEYKNVCSKINEIEAQRPSQFEMFTEENFDALDKVNELLKPWEEKRDTLKTWFNGYMSVYADMHDMDTMNKIYDILSAIEHGRA